MNHNEKCLVVQFIRPNAEWSLIDDELLWLDANQDEPTKSEIDAGWIAYQAKIAQDKKAAEDAKAAAEAKLSALGLTPDDLKALGL